jgi:DNA-directed RNA polymerase II subunit RPB1
MMSAKRKLNDDNARVIKRCRVDSVQFGLLSSEEIEQLSAVEVSDVIINRSGIVHKNGVNDSAMGTVIRQMLCSTCGCEMQSCPGHMGHIKLETPVLNIEFISHVLKILTCVCFHCSRLLFPVDHPKYASTMKIDCKKKRQSEIYGFCQKIRKCTTHVDYKKRKDKTNFDINANNKSFVSCDGCNGDQPTYIRDDILIRAVFTLSFSEVEGIKSGEFEVPLLTPSKILTILKHIKHDDILLLGMDPVHAHPSSMMWCNLVVPPVPMRPSRSKSNNTKIGGEDDLTIRLRGIVKANKQYSEFSKSKTEVNLAKYVYNSSTYKDIQHVLLEMKHVDVPGKKVAKTSFTLYQDLQRLVAGYQDSKYQNKATDGSEYGREKKSVRHRFTGQKAKKGRMRHTVFGKRQNYSSRTVITPYSNMDIDQVGVPKWICMKLTYPERVNRYNIHVLSDMVRNGADVHPGANYIVDEKGKVISLKFVDRFNIKLHFGWIVRRHLKDGDDVLFNRQPSLHKQSLMAHRVKVMPGHSFRLHMAVTKPYNADFDGDEMNLQVVMDELTRSEARGLLSVRHNMVKDTVPLVCFQQNTVASAYLMSRPGEFLTKDDACQLLFQNKYFDISDVPTDITLINGKECFTGLQVFSACLPNQMYVQYDDLLIEKGQILKGRLTSSTLNKGVLYTIWKDFGVDAACDFISGMQLLLESYLNIQGLTVGVDDCYIDLPHDLKTKIVTAMNYVEQYSDHYPDNTGKPAEVIEKNICLILDKARDIVGDHVLGRLKENAQRNGLYEMIQSGAKGNETNIIQIVGLVGQQRNHHSMRMSNVTSHYKTGENKAYAHGMVCRSFFRGLRPEEYFNHLVGSRVGLVDTAVKTSETGYSQRRIAKAMEDLVVNIDKTVRNGRSDIVQYVYGDDGFDSSSVEPGLMRTIMLTEVDVLSQYRCVPSIKNVKMDPSTLLRWAAEIHDYKSMWRLEINTLLYLREQIIDTMIYSEYNNRCLCPVAFDRLLKRATFERASETMTDLTPKDVRETIMKFWNNLISTKVLIPTLKIKCLFWDWCSTKTIWHTFGLDRKSLRWFMSTVHDVLLRKSITPHESVGILASQHCAEPLIQLTLNRFHMSGQFSHLVSGVARMKEIINVVKNPKTPCMSIVVKPGYDLEDLGHKLTEVMSHQIIDNWQSSFTDNDRKVRNHKFRTMWSRWQDVKDPIQTLIICMDKQNAIRLRISPRMLCNALRYCDLRKKMMDFDSLFSYSDLNDENWWVCVNMTHDDIIWSDSYKHVIKHTHGAVPHDDMVLMYIYEKMIKDCLVKGIRGLEDFYVGSKSFTEIVQGIPKKVTKNVIFTKGTNLIDVLNREEVESHLVVTNHIKEVEHTLGIDAACAAIENEWSNVMTVNNAHVGMRHIKLISEAMCYRGYVCPMTYQGICRENSSVIKKASFEKAMDSFIWGAAQGHNDVVDGCMDSVCWNGILKAGTGKVHLYAEPTNIPKYLTLQQDRIYGNQKITYNPPDKAYYDKYFTPKTKKRFSTRPQSSHEDAMLVKFSDSISNTFSPYSPQKEMKQKIDVVISNVKFDSGSTFNPWTL